jgi:uncharacterized phiE125 gp8 family phage protein
MTYCDTFELKAYLNLQEDSDDTLLGTLIASAQALIDRQTGRTFEAASGTRRYNPTVDCRGRVLWLDADLHSVTSVTNGDGATLAGTDYVTEPRSERPIYAIKLLQSSGIAWTYTTDPEDAIVVVGAWGYSASAPDDIKHACLRLAAFLYRQRDNARDAGVGYTEASGAYVRAMAMPKDVESALAPYARRT